MQVGICKLCLQECELQDSHYISAGIYRRVKRMAGTDPIVLTPKLIVSTGRQVKDHVFCAECEERLNAGGERYVLKISAEPPSYPVRDMLRNGRALPFGPSWLYSGKEIGLDVQKIAYYAVSMLWKGSVHQWKTLDRQITSSKVTSHMEDMRRYLLGEAPFPTEIGVVVTVCLDLISQLHFTAPFLLGDEETDTLFEMLIFGLKLRIGITHPNPAVMALSCLNPPNYPIIASDCEKDTVESVGTFHETARVART
jgi:hypothetical protein